MPATTESPLETRCATRRTKRGSASATSHASGPASDRADRRSDETGVTLANCPFHALAREYTELVCGMNLDLMNGLVEGLETAAFEPRLDPAPGRCCVRLRTSESDSS